MTNSNTTVDVLANIENGSATTIETLQKVGLDWHVAKVQLVTPDGTPTDYYANQRQDNREILHVVREGYTNFQNEELVELCEALAQTFDYKIHSGGSLQGGRKVWLQLDAGSVAGIGANNDKVLKYITAINSFDGTTAVAFGSTGLTISCQNTFYRAYRDRNNLSRVRHTTNLQARIDAAKREVEFVQHQDEELYEKFFRMASAEATKQHVANVVKLITDVDITKTSDQARNEYSTRKVNIAESLLASIQREVSYKGNTLWGLMSGVTHFTTHVASAPKRDNGRIESKMIGGGQSMDTVAFEYLESIIA
jgi:phage/plasmid-like protein (TIGR03299 family)